jgi:magnesium chelatase family protein
MPPTHLRPLSDRIDLHVEVPLVEYRKLSSQHQGESSQNIRERVTAARNIQAARFRGKSATTNAAMGPRQVKARCQLNPGTSGYLEQAIEQMNSSALAHDRKLIA